MKRIGIIGTGKMGLSHFAIANKTPELHVVAVAETNGLVAKVISKYSNVTSYNDYSKMIDAENLDAVIISLPNKLHYEACKIAIDKGINYFVEKPFTLNPMQSYELVEKTRTAKLRGQVGYVNRFNPIFKKLQTLLNEKTIGFAYQYQASMLGSVVSEETKQSWRTSRTEGGGCLYDYGSHSIDLIQFLFGAIANVAAAKLESIYSKNAEDFVIASFIHNSGCYGQMIVNWCDPSQRKAYNEVTIWGNEGKIIANKQEIKIYLSHDDEKQNLHQGWNSIHITDLSTSVPFYLRGEDFALQMVDFCSALSNPTHHLVSSVESAASVDDIIKKIQDINSYGVK